MNFLFKVYLPGMYLYIVLSIGNIDYICKTKPTAVIAMDSNCAKYYNCSKMTVMGHHIEECRYPDLFSPITNQCEPFESVQCHNRTEPMAPCKLYMFSVRKM